MSNALVDTVEPRFSHLRVPGYKHAVRVLGVVLIAAVTPAMDVCAAVVRKLAAIYPDKPVGVFLTIDGTGVAGNVAQVSAGGGADKQRKEAHLRRRIPDAGF